MKLISRLTNFVQGACTVRRPLVWIGSLKGDKFFVFNPRSLCDAVISWHETCYNNR